MTKDKSKPIPVNRLSKYVRNNDYLTLNHWQPRDLRRTFTTLAKGLDFSDLIINKAQARTDDSVIRKYYDKSRYYNELRSLFTSIEKEVLRINGQDPSVSTKVIQLGASK